MNYEKECDYLLKLDHNSIIGQIKIIVKKMIYIKNKCLIIKQKYINQIVYK